jgi:hypothetical protein
MTVVLAVHLDEAHRFSKRPVDQIRLRAGLGVEVTGLVIPALGQ